MRIYTENTCFTRKVRFNVRSIVRVSVSATNLYKILTVVGFIWKKNNLLRNYQCNIFDPQFWVYPRTSCLIFSVVRDLLRKVFSEKMFSGRPRNLQVIFAYPGDSWQFQVLLHRLTAIISCDSFSRRRNKLYKLVKHHHCSPDDYKRSYQLIYLRNRVAFPI